MLFAFPAWSNRATPPKQHWIWSLKNAISESNMQTGVLLLYEAVKFQRLPCVIFWRPLVAKLTIGRQSTGWIWYQTDALADRVRQNLLLGLQLQSEISWEPREDTARTRRYTFITIVEWPTTTCRCAVIAHMLSLVPNMPDGEGRIGDCHLITPSTSATTWVLSQATVNFIRRVENINTSMLQPFSWRWRSW